MMRGIGSASKLWRHLAKGVLMADELAWLHLDLSGNPFGVAGAIKLMSLYLGIVGPESRSDDTADKALPGEQWSRPALATERGRSINLIQMFSTIEIPGMEWCLRWSLRAVDPFEMCFPTARAIRALVGPCWLSDIYAGDGSAALALTSRDHPP
jgi:hypothetical protein